MDLRLQLLVIGSGIVIFYLFKSRSYKSSLPKLENKWWGKEQAVTEDNSIKPFKILVADEVLQDLGERLKKARPFVPPLEGIQQQYGMNANLLQDIVEYWKTKYIWKERETFINQFPHFITKIQGLNIHYIHVKPINSEGLKVLPLVLFHGWPGSVLEFYEIIPILTTPQPNRDFVFEIIAPSLPGYGFSEATTKPGLSITYVAEIFKNLMNRIGFNKYYIQGGDWGSVVVEQMSILFPDKILGLHSNLCVVNSLTSNLRLVLYSIFPRLIVDKEHEHLVYPLGKKFSHLMLEFGAVHIQATKPDTIGVALNDSPVGLAAYILEKFTSGTNKEWINLEDGGLRNKFTYDKLLDNVMLYWITNSITTSMRLYAESMGKTQRSLNMDTIPVEVPSAFVRFSNEIIYTPTSNIKDKFYNLVQVSDYENVGHFAALEEPEILANDVYNAITKMEKMYKNNIK